MALPISIRKKQKPNKTMSHLLLKSFNLRLLLLFALSLALFLAISLGATSGSKKGIDNSYLLREGTKLDAVQGFFQAAADRTVFFVKNDKRRFICLENLALQRIGTQSVNAQWRVRGTVTEFNGENYLLIEMAIMTSVQ